MIEELKNKAEDLLSAGKADVVIGYKRTSDGISAMPAFIDKASDVDMLIWDVRCVYNLVNYLKDFPGKKIAIVAKTCDVRSIAVLLQENQVKRENIIIIGVECSGIIDEKRQYCPAGENADVGFDEKCRHCTQAVPTLYDILIRDKDLKGRSPALGEDPYEAVRKLEAKSPAERLKFWEAEFSRCVRCYACRQVCPMCYCPTCVADQTAPAWFSKAVSLEGNLSWNVTRAMHLAGRCIDCGECERVCPVGIPLRELNKKIEKDVMELFNYKAGADVSAKPLFASFGKEDPKDFIK